MRVDPGDLPRTPALLRITLRGEEPSLAVWTEGRLHDLRAASDHRVRSVDRLLDMRLSELRETIDHLQLDGLPTLDLDAVEVLAPVETQEVWAAGVTYRRSREARMEEAEAQDLYALVYEAARPELFFKAAGWRVVAPGGDVGIRSDSTWDVPEPELAVLSNRWGEVVAYACGNDMSSRSIEGENPLYLPQAKVYDAACAIGPAAVFAWQLREDVSSIEMTITRDDRVVFSGETPLGAMVRDASELVAVLHAVYSLPVGAWLLTGTGIVPPAQYTAAPDDEVVIQIDGVGILRNRVKRIVHSGATAAPRP
jgi:2-dehydro-3-deoxy-D-arabinonate dehydratase